MTRKVSAFGVALYTDSTPETQRSGGLKGGQFPSAQWAGAAAIVGANLAPGAITACRSQRLPICRSTLDVPS